MKFLKLFQITIGALFLLMACSTSDISQGKNSIKGKLNEVLSKNKDFNGTILITQNEKILVDTLIGLSDKGMNIPFKKDDQFVIGSISKQLTAVLVLKEVEKGTLDLNAPISKYLKYTDYNKPWTDSVTTHHLLTHTHGISQVKKYLGFVPGTQFEYSQIGYEILAEILQVINGKSFKDISMDFFIEHGMKNTVHPYIQKYDNLVQSYEGENSEVVPRTMSLANYVPAGTFISNMYDLDLWNKLLYSGKLLQPASFERMKKRYATRQHPIYGEVEYGYGLLFKNGEANQQIGALGYAPGFSSACYFFPEKNISVVVLSNEAKAINDFAKVFSVHLDILKMIKNVN